MSIHDLNDWGAVELAAQTHELQQVETPKVPEPPKYTRHNSYGFLKLYRDGTQIASTALPGMEGVEYLNQIEEADRQQTTVGQKLVWLTMHCAELQAKIYRMQGRASEALMWLQAGDKARVQQAINQVILDL